MRRDRIDREAIIKALWRAGAADVAIERAMTISESIVFVDNGDCTFSLAYPNRLARKRARPNRKIPTHKGNRK